MEPIVDTPRAAYLHVPFCRRRCGYCNFTLVAGRDDLIDAYLEAIARELDALGGPRPVDTLFFGGGTPTHLPPDRLDRLLTIARRTFPLAGDGEFSVEANPIDMTLEKIDVLAAHGVNRLSLGVQSIDDRKLAVLERDHRRADVEAAIERCRPRFASLSLDLIFGAPGETLDVWLADLQFAIEAPVDHLSTYGMTYDQGAAFWARRERGQLEPMDEALEAEAYEQAIERLTAAGFEHYEVSNFARPGRACRHNETYWRGDGYFAAGPGASRYVDGRRETNHRSTTAYLRKVLSGESPTAESERLPAEDAARERLVFGLRRIAGVDVDDFARRTGFTVESLVARELEPLVARGLLERTGARLRLTRAGLLVSDMIWPRFLRR